MIDLFKKEKHSMGEEAGNISGLKKKKGMKLTWSIDINLLSFIAILSMVWIGLARKKFAKTPVGLSGATAWEGKEE